MSIDMDRRAATWDANPQLDSPFFSSLPAEIRRGIYSYALTPEIYTYAGRKFSHDFRIALDHDGDPDDDIRDYLERLRRRCPGGSEALREALRDWDSNEPHRWKGPRKYHPDPYRRLLASMWEPPPYTCTSERPGYIGRPVLRPTILLASRRAYTEARPVLFAENERCFWAMETHKHPDGNTSLPLVWPRERRRWERKFTTIHLLAHTTCIRWAMFPEQHLLSKVKHLRLTIRDCDWRDLGRELDNVRVDASTAKQHDWSIEFFDTSWAAIEEPIDMFVIDPFTHNEERPECARPLDEETMSWLEDSTSGNGSFGGQSIIMKTGSDRSKPRPCWVPPSVDFIRGAWGREFINMHHIETFTMSFDACESDRPAVAAFVDWAVRAWRFPLNPIRAGHHYLSAAGNPVKKMSWRGTRGNVRAYCPHCLQHIKINWSALTGGDNDCDMCWRSQERFLMNLGPRMYTWTVTWTPRRHDDATENSYPLHNFVEPADYDLGDDESVSGVENEANEGER